MTTHGIINGTDAYAIRSVRDTRYKLILNLNHQSKFTNACTRSPAFQSMVAKAKTGDATARRLVHAYQNRPAVELYDMQKDPLELANIAGQTGTEKHIIRLRSKLEAWMKSQGDQGVETELKASERQGAKRRNKRNILKKK